MCITTFTQYKKLSKVYCLQPNTNLRLHCILSKADSLRIKYKALDVMFDFSSSKTLSVLIVLFWQNSYPYTILTFQLCTLQVVVRLKLIFAFFILKLNLLELLLNLVQYSEPVSRSFLVLISLQSFYHSVTSVKMLLYTSIVGYPILNMHHMCVP